jgi:hypothetical protein
MRRHLLRNLDLERWRHGDRLAARPRRACRDT